MKNSEKTSFDHLEGSAHILVTAPHAFNHRRPTLTGTTKQSEPWTDYIAKAICEETSAHGLIQSADSRYDPNYQKEISNPFKRKMRELQVATHFKYCLDIHGLSDLHKYDIAIYYPWRFIKSRKLAYSLAAGLNQGKLRGALIQIFYMNEDRGETISQFAVKELKLPSVQIEVARYIREDSVLREELIKLLSRVFSSLP